MDKWEYKIYHSTTQTIGIQTIEQNDLQILNGFGEEGWELVSAYPLTTARVISGYYYILKKRKTE